MLSLNYKTLSNIPTHPQNPDNLFINPSQESVEILKDKFEESTSSVKIDFESEPKVREREDNYDPIAPSNNYIAEKLSKTIKKIRTILEKIRFFSEQTEITPYISEVIDLLNENKSYFRRSRNFRIVYGVLLQIFNNGYWMTLSMEQISTINLQLGRLISGNESMEVVSRFVTKLAERDIKPLSYLSGVTENPHG